MQIVFQQIGRYKIKLLLCFFILNALLSYSQDSIKINKPRLILVSSAYTATYSSTMLALSKVWYGKQNTSSFHFFNDLPEWYQMDKLGHVYGAYHQAFILDEMLQWCNLSKTQSAPIATLSSLLTMSSIEVFDGFVSSYGASLSDVAANSVGAFAYLLSTKDKFKGLFTPKFSFSPSKQAVLRPQVLGYSYAEQLIKDYNGQTYWLGLNIKKLIAPNTRFPSWLGIAIGYGAQNMIYANESFNVQQGYEGYRAYYLAFDIDLSAIKTRHKWLAYTLRRLNAIHLPLPAIELNRNQLNFHYYYF